jgi:hypothetical protein
MWSSLYFKTVSNEINTLEGLSKISLLLCSAVSIPDRMQVKSAKNVHTILSDSF